MLFVAPMHLFSLLIHIIAWVLLFKMQHDAIFAGIHNSTALIKSLPES